MTEEKRNITVRIFRYDPTNDKKPHFDSYKIPYKKVIEEKMSVLTALLYIYENIDSTISFQYSCRGGDCHCCDMIVNGRAVEACSARVTGDITIEPPVKMGFKVIKDLIASDITTTDEDHFISRSESVWKQTESFVQSISPEHALVKFIKKADRQTLSEDDISKKLKLSKEKVKKILDEVK